MAMRITSGFPPGASPARRRPRDSGGRRVLAAIQGRQRLARQHQHGRLVAQLHDVAIGLDDLVGVAGPQHDQPGNGAQRRELLDRLVGRAVFAVAHGVVGEDENRGQLHQGREPNGGPRVVAEDEEGRAEGPELRERESVDDRRHRVLADAEMQVLSAGTVGLEISRTLERQRGLVRRCRDPPSRRGTRGCSARAR